MNELIKEARGLLGVMTADIADDGYFECREAEHNTIKMLCDALEKAEGKLDYLHEEIGSVRAQLHTATFSTNKGAADMAKFILALLPAPPEKEGE